jgi:integrase
MGSMTFRGKDRRGLEVWELRISLGYDVASGGYPRFTERFHGPAVNARRRLHELEDGHDDGQVRRATVCTLGEWFEIWLGVLPMHVRSRRTVQEYTRHTRKTLIPKLGRIRPRKLTVDDVDTLLADQRERGLQPESVAKIKTVLSSALTAAQRRGIVSINVARLSGAVSIPRRRITAIDEAATDNLLAALQQDELWWYTICGVAVTTGMRRGELTSVQLTDVDLAGSMINVQAGADEDDEGVTLSDPKSRAGTRTIRLHERTVQMLAVWELALDTYRRKYGDLWEENNLVFPALNRDVRKGVALRPGRPMLPHSVTRRWTRTRATGVVPAAMRFYDLRHTHATHLLHAGVNVKVVAERLGHESEATTLERYAFALPDMQAAAVDALGWLNLLT